MRGRWLAHRMSSSPVEYWQKADHFKNVFTKIFLKKISEINGGGSKSGESVWHRHYQGGELGREAEETGQSRHGDTFWRKMWILKRQHSMESLGLKREIKLTKLIPALQGHSQKEINQLET